MTPRLRLPAALIAAAALAGCNDSPRIGEAEHVATTVETLLEECAAQSGPAVYDLLAADAKRVYLEAGGVLEGCQAVTGLGDAEEIPASTLFERARVTGVARYGDQARARISVPDGEDVVVNLLDTGTLWFVAGPPLYEPVGEDDLP